MTKASINNTLYDFSIYYEDDENMEIQHRYVIASSEREAEQKFEAYNNQQVKMGFARMIYIGGATVDCDYIIG